MNQPSYPIFQAMNIKKLREYAKNKGVTGYSGLDKDQIITKLYRWILLNEGFDLRPSKTTERELTQHEEPSTSEV